MIKPPIETIHLFAPLEKRLIELLRTLGADDWNRTTLAKLWTVKDVAAHLLDTQLRGLALAKNYFGEVGQNINSYQDLVNYLNQLNADWVKAMKRVDPDTLILLLERTQDDYISYLQSLEPFQQAAFSVAWAGEEKSANWFHIAREYTERWHHQQQIREAVNKPGIMTVEFFGPVLETFMMALPYTYRHCKPDDDSCVSVLVTGDLGGEWRIRFENGTWNFYNEQKIISDTTISMDADTAWKLMTKAVSKKDCEEKIKIEGNIKLGQPIFAMVSVMA